MADLVEAALAEIRRVAAEELEIARPVSPGDELRSDLRLDSIGAVVLAVALEDRFRVRLSDSDAAAVVTVGDLAALVARRVREARAAEAPAESPDRAAG